MKTKVKPGIASLIVFTAATIILFWAAVALDAPKELYAFLSAILLLIVWWSLWRRARKLARRIEELSDETAAARATLQQDMARLQAEVTELRGSAPASRAATAAAIAPPAASKATEIARTQQAFVPPPPPPLSVAGRAVSAPTFAELGAAARGASPGIFQRLRSLLKFEELLGTNWMAKIGALMLVLGIAFLLNLALSKLGPAGKIVVGWAVAAALLGAGIFFERQERYRIIARAGVAAGWGIAFFTAFAMNHVPATATVLPSGVADLALMFMVAAVMVLHTLRYRSQVATGLAFLAAFASIFATVFPYRDLPPPGVSSLAASIVLALGVAWVALRRQWFILETCAIAATFLNHFVWLIHIIRPMGKHHHHFPEFLPSAMILVGYWAVYRASYLIRRGEGYERISALGALLNTGLLLAVLKYQSVHPEYAFWALLALGALELGLGQLPQARRRSIPHIVLTVIGACLLFTAIPFRLGMDAKGVAVLWLAMAQAFFLVGVLTREKVFQRVGLFAFVPLFGQLISMEVATIAGARSDGADFKGEFLPAAVSALTSLVLYLNVHWAPRRWAAQFADIVEQKATRDLSYAAAVLAFSAAWLAFPNLGTVVGWMALACALAWAAYRFRIQPLRWQSIGIAAFAFIRVVNINLPAPGSYHFDHQPWSARLVSTVIVVALCYLAAYCHRRAEIAGLQWLEPSFTWAASTMFTLLMWYELSSVGVALGWSIFALIMLEAGLWRRSLNLRVQGHVAAASAFLRLLFVNLNANSASGLSPKLYSIVPLIAVFFYFYQRLYEQQETLSPLERRIKAAPVFAWLGTISIVLLLRFEIPLDWVATAWAATVLAAMSIAWWSGRRVFAHQAMLLSLAVLFRGVFHNLYERSYFHPLSPILSNLSTISAAGLLFASLVCAFRIRRGPPKGRQNRLARAAAMLDAHPEQLLFFVALILLTAFLGTEVRSGFVTLAWGVEAVAIFLAALWIGERSYRLSAMALLILVVGKIFIVDLRHMTLSEKAVSFTVLGVAIMGVSILYSKNREKVRQFL